MGRLPFDYSTYGDSDPEDVGWDEGGETRVSGPRPADHLMLIKLSSVGTIGMRTKDRYGEWI